MPHGQGVIQPPEDWLRAGAPGSTTTFAESASRTTVATDVAAALVTQVMTSVALPLQIGDLVTSLTFVSGATAAGTPTNWWFALYSSAATPALLAQTADQTSTAWGADTVKTVALATPQLITASGIYYAAIMVKATTVPSLMCAGSAVARLGAFGAVVTGAKILAQNSGSALTTTAPGTVASPTTQGAIPYCVAT